MLDDGPAPTRRLDVRLGTILRSTARRLLLVPAFSALGAIAGCATSSGETGFPPPGIRYRVVPVPWHLVGTSGRTLTLGYLPPACAQGDAQAEVQETREEVSVSLTVVVRVGTTCAPPTGDRTLEVRLRAPLGHRALGRGKPEERRR